MEQKKKMPRPRKTNVACFLPLMHGNFESSDMCIPFGMAIGVRNLAEGHSEVVFKGRIWDA